MTKPTTKSCEPIMAGGPSLAGSFARMHPASLRREPIQPGGILPVDTVARLGLSEGPR
jgi:hypothetical protein